MMWSFSLKWKDEQPQVLTNFVKEIFQLVNIECWKFDNTGKNKMTLYMFKENGFGINVHLQQEK
jgi:hypothetical protein